MRTIRSKAGGALAALLVVATSPALAAPREAFDIPAQDLDAALRKLADAARVELLFDHAAVAGLRSRRVHGALAPDEALERMIAGAPLAYRRVAAGAYVIVVVARPARQPAIAETEPAIAEILVVGRRTQNVDIRRGVNDIQPYKLLSAGQIADAQADDVEDLLRQHLSADAVLSTLKQAPIVNIASSRSQVNLHGMGADQTLILVDGRRMPATPSYQAFGQPDLNGLPLLAIDRIETLSTTAGGIYGPGATGGVVNIVLKRDYSGGEVETGGGITQRGDAGQWRASVAMGGAWFDQRLRLFAAASYTHEGGLAFVDRDYAQNAQAARYVSGFALLPVSKAWNVGDSAFQTSAPLNVPLASATGQAALSANAGQVDVSLPNDGQGLMQSLLTRTTIKSAIVSSRFEINDHLQVFFDVLALQNTGAATGPRLDTSRGVTVPVLVPFDSGAKVVFPTPGWSAAYTNRSRTIRGSLGAIARLGHDWNAELDVSLGQASIRSRQPANLSFSTLASITGLDPTTGWPAVEAALAPYANLPDVIAQSIDRFSDASLRVGGPAFQAPGGPVTLTMMVEARRNRLPKAALSDIPAGEVDLYDLSNAVPSASPLYALREDETVYSAYAEARAPLFRRDTAPWLLRGLELQLALRGDRYAYRIPAYDAEVHAESVTSRGKPASTTVGLRAWPLDGVMVRASYATGYVPPKLADMKPASVIALAGIADPKRGGEQIAGGGGVREDFDGSPNVRPERATSLTAGLVLEPRWAAGLRVTLDYTHLIKSNEVSYFLDDDMAYVVAHEASLPGRVDRLPLTDADRAQGFTGGIITRIDTSATNLGRSTADMVEIAINHRLATRLGLFQSYAEGTWIPHFRRRTSPDDPAYNVVDALDGPMALRGDLGVEWSRGGWSSGLSAHAYDGYRVSYAEPSLLYWVAHWSSDNLHFNGRTKIPPQIYFDGDVAWRPHAFVDRAVVWRLGVRNLLDQRPPAAYVYLRPDISTEDISGYSTLGDPRGRRFVTSITARF